MPDHQSQFGQVVVRPVVFIVFVLAQFYLILIPRHDTLDLEAWPNTVPSPRIIGTRSVGQTFVPKINNLAEIDLLMATHRLALTKDLVFRLFEGGPDGRLAAEVRVPGSSLKDNLFHPIRFKPIRRSKGKTFTFVLSMPEATESEAPSIWTNPADIISEGGMMIAGRPTEGDCVFRTYSRRTIIAEWERISHGVPGRWGNPFTLAVAALLFEIALAVAFWRILGWFFLAPSKEKFDA